MRRYLKQDRLVPSGFMNALEAIVEFVRDSIVLPNVGQKWVNTWTPLILTFFVFILCANAIGLIPMFDVLGLLDHCVLHTGRRLVRQAGDARRHDGDRRTSTSRRRSPPITFGAIIVAGTKAHGFVEALEEPGAARPGVADLHPADPDRDHGACSSGRSR